MQKKILVYGKMKTCASCICPICKKEFWRTLTEIRRRKNSYCSAKCSHKAQTNRIIKECSLCKKEFETTKNRAKRNKSGYDFCSKNCKDIAQRIGSGFDAMMPAHYGTSERDYRVKAYRKYGEVCNRCGYTNKKALEVHHKDRNRKNNKIENLEVLCANCHTVEHYGWQTSKASTD